MLSTIDISDPILPPELILRIVNLLDPDSDDDRLSLTQCTLISKTFRQDAQKQLFSSVRLVYTIGYDPDEGQRRIMAIDTPQSSRFLLAITQSPILATFVLRLFIRLCFKSRLPATSKYLYKDAASTQDSSSLPVILPYMSNLEEFTWHNRQCIRWTVISPVLKASIQAVIQGSNIRKLDMSRTIHMPLSLFCNSSGLQSLKIVNPKQDIMLLTDTRPPPSVALTNLTVNFLPLSNYDIRSLVQFFQNPKCPISLKSLQHLRLTAPEVNEEEVRSMLDICSNTLTHLYWVFQQTPPPHVLREYSVVDLKALSKLSHLYLSGTICNDWGPVQGGFTEILDSPIAWIVKLLQSLPDSNKKFLSLSIRFHVAAVSLSVVECIHWSDLTDALTIPGQSYRSLSVSLAFTDSHISSSLSTAEPNLVEKRLEMLKNNIHLKKLGDALVFS
ncbi:hypothetical protein BJ165DRAFT_1402043 [Panaeolus papilionaceus]|nr:hypothetical protein BJ165DRAFT_1402043 [Panaeolus papilionaceus]